LCPLQWTSLVREHEEKHGSTSLQTQKQATFSKVHLHFVYIFASIS